MAPLTLSNHLGLLQDDPDDVKARDALLLAFAGGDKSVLGDDPLRMLEAARQAHEARGESSAAALLLELEIPLVASDPDRAAQKWKALARLRHDDLLDDEGARAAYEKARALRPGDSEIAEAIEQIAQTEQSWKDIAKRFLDEAESASDATLKTTLLVRAASLIWQHKKRGREKDVDKIFKEALAADPSSVRAATLYELTLRQRERWEDAAQVLLDAAEHGRNRDEKLWLYVRAARIFARKLDAKPRAAACYERVLDYSPGHAEGMSFLVKYFTDNEQWDLLVALYEDSLKGRLRPDQEEGTLLQIGMVHWRMRGAPAAAEPYFARVRKIAPAHPAMLSFYREHLEQTGDAQRLLTILGDAQRIATEPADKLRLAIEVARAAQANPQTLERAIDGWKAVQRLDPTSQQAHDALRDLYRRAEKWNALIELLKAELDHLPAGEDGRRVAILREMVPIYRDRLQLDVMVINTYNALLQLVPDDREALEALASTYESTGRFNDLIQVLTRQADAGTDSAERVKQYLRVANLWIDRFANYNQATKPLEQVVTLDPNNREALGKLKDIYAKKRAWKPLYDVLKRESELASDPGARLANKVELAKLAGERLQMLDEAIGLWRAVLDEDPNAPGALDALEKLAEREKDFPTLADAIERRIAQTSDDKEKVKLLTRLGGIYADSVRDPLKAAGAWKRVLALDPKNGRAMRTLRDAYLAAGDWESLEVLSAEQNDWEGFVEVLGGAADKASDPAQKIALSFRAAEVYEKKLGEPARAFRSYERVLSVDPQNVRAARALLPIYEKEEKWARLCAQLETILGALGDDAGSEKLELLVRLRDLSLERLRDADAAFKFALRAYEIAPTDKRIRDGLEAATERAGTHAALAKAYEARVEKAPAEERTWLRRRIAALSGERLGQSDAAVQQFKEIVASDPHDAEALAALDRIYKAEGRHSDRRSLLLHRIEHATDSTEKWVALGELAQLEETALGDPDSAAGRYRSMLEIDPTDKDALAALDRLATDGHRWTELAEILRKRRELVADDAARRELTLRLGALLSEKLADPPGAVAAFAEVLEKKPDDADAVAALERIVEATPAVSNVVGPLLETAYAAGGAHAKLAGILEKRLAACTDKSEKRELRLRLADLRATRLGDEPGAYDVLEAAFLDAPSDSDLWDRLAEAAARGAKQEALAHAYGTAIEAGDLGASDATDLSRRLAALYDDVLGRPADAEPFHRRVLAHDPLDERSFLALKEFYTTAERWDDLQLLYRNRIAQTVDAQAKLDLLMQVCFLFEEILDDPALAIRAYQDVLELEPGDEASRRALERLYLRAERWRDLAALIRVDLDRASGQDAIDLTFRLGELHQQKLSEPGTAVDLFGEVLAQQPTHLRAQEALEKLLDEPTQRQRVAAILEPLHDRQGAYSDLVKVLEVQLEDVHAPGARAALLSRIAELSEQKLHDPSAAFNALARAVESDPSDAKAREELARLAGIRGAHRERAEVLERALGQARDSTALQAELYLELAKLWDEREDDPARAEGAYDRLITVAGDDPELVLTASRALERIHLGRGDHAKLAEDLRRQVRFENDQETRKRLLTRLGELFETILGDTDAAIAAHRERLDADPADVDAMRALERLFEQKGQWTRLIGILQSRDRVTDAESDRREIARQVGRIYEDKLGDRDNAVVAYNAVLDNFGKDRDTLAALARLYQAQEKWQDLLDVLEMDLELAERADEKAEIRFRAGELMRLHTGDKERAIEAFAEVLDTLPDHAGAIASLEEMTASDGDARVAAARVLLPRYEARASYEKLLAALDVVASSDDPAERLKVLVRAAQVADLGLADSGRAFEHMAKAVRAGVTEPDLAPLLSELERLAAASERWNDYVALLRDIAPDVMDAELQTDVHAKIADAARTRLQDPALASQYYAKVLEQRPDALDALDALEKIDEEAGDYRALLDVLRRKTELATGDSDRLELLLRQARISADKLDDARAAVDCYEQVLEASDRMEAYEGLVKLYSKTERWNDLARLYERQIERRVGEPVEVRHALGCVYLLQLSEPVQALEQFREAIAANSSHARTIAVLETMMAKSEHKGVAAEILEPVFLARGEWPKVTAALEARLEGESDLDARKRLLTRLAQIQEDQLEDLEASLETYARLFREDPSDETVWDTLGRLARVLDRWGRLADIYGSALEDIAVDDPQTAKLALSAGRIHDQKTGDLVKAAVLYRRALRFDPTDRAAFDAVESVYQRSASHRDLLELYEQQSEVAATDEERVALVHKMAQIQETALSDPDKAVDAFRRVLEIDPRDSVAIASLDRLLTERERWTELADHLRHRIDLAAGTAEEYELSHRLGEILATKIGDKTAAIDVYEDIARRNPSHGPTVRALEVLVQDLEHRVRIIRVLEPIYESTDQWKKLIAIHEAEVELTEDPADRARLLGQIANLHEHRGRDQLLAFHAWGRAFVDDPSNEEARGEIDRLAASLGAWDDHVAVYERALPRTDDPATKAMLLATIARVHDERRGDPRGAIETYERLLALDENDVTALDALEGLHTMVGDWRGLVDICFRKVERSLDAIERGEILRRAGSVLEELVGDRAAATDAYRRALEESDTDEIALESLDRLYTNAQDHQALFGVLKRRIELGTDPEQRAELGLRLGELAATTLSRPQDAIEAYERVLEDRPNDPTSVLALGTLYEKQGQWSQLLDNLRLRAATAQTSADRVELLVRAAGVLEREMDDTGEAIDVYRQAVEIDPSHEAGIGALMRISEHEDHRARVAEILEPLLREQRRWDDLATLLERTASTKADPAERSGELRRLAEVHEQGRQDAAAAFDALRRALAEDPGDTGTADELERLAAGLTAWDKLADTFAARASASLDPQTGRALYVRLARIASDQLGDDSRAIEAYSRATEQVGDDDELLAALDGLFQKTQQWRELADVIDRRIAIATDPAATCDLLVRVGAIREERFDDKKGALAAYRDVLDRDPTDARATDALERLLGDAALAPEIVEILEGVYRQTNAAPRIASLYGVKIRLAGSDADRVRLLTELAQLYESDLGDPGQAIEAYRRAFELDPRDESLLGELERLAPVVGSWDALRGLVEGVEKDARLDASSRRDLSLRAARWYRDHLGDAAAAEQRFRAAIAAQGDTPEAHAELVDLLRVPGREADLVAALRAAAAIDMDGGKDKLREAARLAEAALGDASTAAACHEAILANDPTDAEALDDLSRIRMLEQKWADVVDLLSRRIDVEPSPETRLELRHRLAEIYRGPMPDDAKAIEAYRAILDEQPAEAAALDALEALYEKGERWKDLGEILERRLEDATTTEARIGARVRLARLAEQRFGKRAEAIEQLREILLEDPANGEALDELERLFTADSRWPDLVELLERRAGDAAAAGRSDEELGALVRLGALHEQHLGDRTAAVGMYSRVLERDPRHAGALAARLRLHEAANDWASAATDVETLLEVLPPAEAVLQARALAKLCEDRLGDAARAEAALLRALAMEPASAATRDLLKAHYEKHGEHAKLAAMLIEDVEATAETPAKVALLRRVAQLYSGPLADPAGAASCLEQAVALVPEDRDVLLPLCDLYIEAGRQRDAVPVLEKIIASFGAKRSKELATYHHRLGRALEGLGDVAAARAQLDAAFKIDLTNVPILRDLGRLAHGQNDFDVAQKTFRALLLQKLDAQSGITKADVYFYLGDISFKQGDKPKAVSMLERALSEQRDHARAVALLAQVKAS